MATIELSTLEPLDEMGIPGVMRLLESSIGSEAAKVIPPSEWSKLENIKEDDREIIPLLLTYIEIKEGAPLSQERWLEYIGQSIGHNPRNSERVLKAKEEDGNCFGLVNKMDECCMGLIPIEERKGCKFPQLKKEGVGLIDYLSGGLRSHYLLYPGTFQHVDQLTKASINDPSLLGKKIQTADGNAFYFNRKHRAFWAITRESDNALLKHIYASGRHNSVSQLSKNGHFFTYKEDSKGIFERSEIIDLSKLHSNDRDDFSFLDIRIKDGYVGGENDQFLPPNPEQEKLMNRIGITEEYLELVLRSYPSEKSISIWLRSILDMVYKIGEDRIMWKSLSFNGILFNVYSEYNGSFNQVMRGCRILPPPDDPDKNEEFEERRRWRKELGKKYTGVK